ncbi:MAG: histidine phosphatase family protein [Verrucomicrobia bacterium]|nr:histidine phosphatase family protein [Verrucomicrobiota bacterium]
MPLVSASSLGLALPLDSPSTRLLLLRHGEVEERYHRIFGGRIDMELSRRGHEQALALAECLKSQRVEALFSSPMKRAQQTMAPLAAALGHEAITLPDLREVDFGAWTGLGWEEVSERFQVRAFDWLAQLERDAIPGAESGAQLRARITPCLRDILRASSGQTAAVVCHGGVIRVILSLLLELQLPKMAGFEIDYASVTVVKCRPRKTEVVLLNYTPWNGLP